MDYYIFDECRDLCLDLFELKEGKYSNKIINGKLFTFRQFKSVHYKKLRQSILFITHDFPDNCSIQERVFCILNNIQQYEYHYCKTCGKIVNFNNVSEGYRRFCGNGGCVYKSDEFKKNSRVTMVERYGVEYPLQSEVFQDKHKKTCLEKYGYENVSQSHEIQDVKRNTCMERYGVSHHSKTPEWKLKCDITKLEKYGDENYNNTPKNQTTCLERYGVSSPTKLSFVQEKIAVTNLAKYGHKSGFFC